jgi:hypothetical protein
MLLLIMLKTQNDRFVENSLKSSVQILLIFEASQFNKQLLLSEVESGAENLSALFRFNSCCTMRCRGFQYKYLFWKNCVYIKTFITL